MLFKYFEQGQLPKNDKNQNGICQEKFLNAKYGIQSMLDLFSGWVRTPTTQEYPQDTQICDMRANKHTSTRPKNMQK